MPPIAPHWRTQGFGIEVEFSGMSFAAATEVIAAAVPQPAQIVWPRGGRDATPGHYSGGHEVFDPIATSGARGPWSIKSDSSVDRISTASRGEGNGCELVSPVIVWERDAAILASVVMALRAAGGVTNSSTGLHVHVGAEHLDGQKLRCLISQVFAHEELLFRAIGIWPERLNSYARPLAPAKVECSLLGRGSKTPSMEMVIQRCDLAASRYQALNLTNIGTYPKHTVEFRHFNSTLDPDMALACAQIALALVTYARECTTYRAGSSKTVDPSSARYDFRVFLLRLGMSGPEFKAARENLLANLPGDASFKRTGERGRTAHASAGRTFATTALSSYLGGAALPVGDVTKIASPSLWSTAHDGQGVTPALWYFRVQLNPNAWDYFTIQLWNGGYWLTFTHVAGQPVVRWVTPAGERNTAVPEARYSSLKDATTAAKRFLAALRSSRAA